MLSLKVKDLGPSGYAALGYPVGLSIDLVESGVMTRFFREFVSTWLFLDCFRGVYHLAFTLLPNNLMGDAASTSVSLGVPLETNPQAKYFLGFFCTWALSRDCLQRGWTKYKPPGIGWQTLQFPSSASKLYHMDHKLGRIENRPILQLIYSILAYSLITCND